MQAQTPLATEPDLLRRSAASPTPVHAGPRRGGVVYSSRSSVLTRRSDSMGVRQMGQRGSTRAPGPAPRTRGSTRAHSSHSTCERTSEGRREREQRSEEQASDGER
eukprot:3662774-Rhodomonas_salina.1